MEKCKKCGIEFGAYDNFCQSCTTPTKRAILPEFNLNHRYYTFHYNYDGGIFSLDTPMLSVAGRLMILFEEKKQARKIQGLDKNYEELKSTEENNSTNISEVFNCTSADNKSLVNHQLMGMLRNAQSQDTVWVIDTKNKTIEMIRGTYVPKNFMEKYFVGYTYSSTREFWCNILHKMSAGLLPGDIFFYLKKYLV